MSSTPNYKYLVAEDESLIRKNLIKKITALNLPLTLIGEAANGMEAIVKVGKGLSPPCHHRHPNAAVRRSGAVPVSA